MTEQMLQAACGFTSTSTIHRQKNDVDVWHVKEHRCMGDLAIFLVSRSHARCDVGSSQFSRRKIHATGAAGL